MSLKSTKRPAGWYAGPSSQRPPEKSLATERSPPVPAKRGSSTSNSAGMRSAQTPPRDVGPSVCRLWRLYRGARLDPAVGAPELWRARVAIIGLDRLHRVANTGAVAQPVRAGDS